MSSHQNISEIFRDSILMAWARMSIVRVWGLVHGRGGVSRCFRQKARDCCRDLATLTGLKNPGRLLLHCIELHDDAACDAGRKLGDVGVSRMHIAPGMLFAPPLLVLPLVPSSSSLRRRASSSSFHSRFCTSFSLWTGINLPAEGG